MVVRADQVSTKTRVLRWRIVFLLNIHIQQVTYMANARARNDVACLVFVYAQACFYCSQRAHVCS